MLKRVVSKQLSVFNTFSHGNKENFFFGIQNETLTDMIELLLLCTTRWHENWQSHVYVNGLNCFCFSISNWLTGIGWQRKGNHCAEWLLMKNRFSFFYVIHYDCVSTGFCITREKKRQIREQKHRITINYHNCEILAGYWIKDLPWDNSASIFFKLSRKEISWNWKQSKHEIWDILKG